MYRIPNFNDDRIKFVMFIQQNKDIFDELLFSGKYYLTRGLNDEYVKSGYGFCRNLSLGDDVNETALTDDLDSFNDDDEQEIDINLTMNEFQKWLKKDITKTYFKKKINEKIKTELGQNLEKRRSVRRTLQIKEELGLIDYVPDDSSTSIKGKIYRSRKKDFEKNKTKGGKKTKRSKKTKKNRRLK